MKDLFEEAKGGYYIYTRSKAQERDQRIKGTEKAIETNNSQIEAMQEKLKKLNEKLMALQKEALPDEDIRSKTKPIEKQIESINEQLAKLYALQKYLSEDLAEASTARKLR